MALIIEDGSIVAGANSYITVAEYNAWADARFGASRSTAPATDAEAEQLILRAMDYFEGQNFQGELVEKGQPLQWPRAWVCIDGYVVETNEIPPEVKNSIYELSYAEEQGSSELSAVSQKVKRKKAGSVEIEYSDYSSSTTINRAVPNAMKKLLTHGGGMRVFRV